MNNFTLPASGFFNSIIMGDVKSVMAWIDWGVNVNLPEDNELPLAEAVRYKRAEIAGILIQSGANIYPDYLFEAIRHDDIACVRILTRLGTDLEVKDELDYRPYLMMSVAGDDV